jgi:hypothetical protein
MKNRTIKALSFFLIISTAFLIKTTIVLADTQDNTVPTIMSTTQIEEKNGNQIMVSGLVANDYNVAVYINGDYYGLANISKLNNTLSKFSFLSKTINDSGPFTVSVMSQSKNNHLLSAPVSVEVQSVIEKSSLQLNASHETIKQQNNQKTKNVQTSKNNNQINPPSLLTSTSSICTKKMLVWGTSDQDTEINLFVDGNFFTSLKTFNQSSGKAFFSYQPESVLSRGTHTAYAIAQNSSGSTSTKSNIVSFCINSPQISTATTSIDNNSTTVATDTQELLTISPSSTTNTVNEKNNNKTKKIFNIAIFLVFAIGLIVWMLLVNRELGKDKKNEKILSDPDKK